jgi:hypothetical protein
VSYGSVIPLISYKTLFYKDTPENFIWNHTDTDHFTYTEAEDYKFKDRNLVENLLSTDGDTVTFYPINNIALDEINGKIVTNNFSIKGKVLNDKTFILGEKYYGLDFEMTFDNNVKRHPTSIYPAVHDADTTAVTCTYGANVISTIVEVQHSQQNYITNIEFPTDLSRVISTDYEYGNQINLDDLYVTEYYSNNQPIDVCYSDYPERFFSYPDKQTILTGNTTFYFGYKSADGRVWPNVVGNEAMWDNISISVDCKVNPGEDSIEITQYPNKQSYIEGEKLNLSGLQLLIKMETGDYKQYDISCFTFTPDDGATLTTNNNSVTITYNRSDDRRISTTFDITVRERQLKNFTIKLPTNRSSLIFQHTADFDSVSSSIICSQIISADIEYDNGVNDTYTLQEISNNISFTAIDDITDQYGVINIPITYTYRTKSRTDYIKIIKRYPQTLMAFNTQSVGDVNSYYIENIKNNNACPFAIECFADDSGDSIIDMLIASNTNNIFSFNKDVCTPNNATHFRITSTNPDTSQLMFDYNMTNMDTDYINKYITLVKMSVPPFTFSNSHHSNVTLYSAATETDPNNITVISPSAFYNDANLLSIRISSNITTIGNGAFTYCRSLSSISFNANIPPVIKDDVFGTNSSNFCGSAIENNKRYIFVKEGKTSFNKAEVEIKTLYSELPCVTRTISKYTLSAIDIT